MMNTITDNELAEKLRRDNCDQFNTLVRMHLSFVLDRNTDDSENCIERGRLKKWSFAPFNKKQKYSRGILEGMPLTHEGVCQVYQLIEHLSKEQNIKIEGIFRRTGSLNRQQDLKSLLNQGITLDLDGSSFSVHDCASVLKGFLAELPEPLLTDAHYPIYCQISELFDVNRKSTQELLHALQLLLLLLPPENRSLLKDVLSLLYLTTSYESSNKMSADNLATLFTPHLLCPRKLSPEDLHGDSQTLSRILSFMISNSNELFNIPPKLAVDIRAYQEKQNRKLLSPKKIFNESVSDNLAANTVYSFVDHERTAKENQSNPTETALAQLYAYIQSLPESSKKRKLVKQFNRENGHGTPLQVIRSNMPKSNKTIGDSIKKHIFHKNIVKPFRNGIFNAFSSDEVINSPSQGLNVKTKLFCGNCDTSSDVSSGESNAKKARRSTSMDDIKPLIQQELKRSNSESDLSVELKNYVNVYLTSTPAVYNCTDLAFTPEDNGRRSMSPITRSTQRMSKAMQETMMTPRSRKPVLLISGTSINKLHKLETQENNMTNVDELSETEINEDSSPKKSKSEGDLLDAVEEEKFNSLNDTFKQYLCSRSILTTTPTDLSFSSRTDDYTSDSVMNMSASQMSQSLLQCMNGHSPKDSQSSEDDREKEPVLRPKQFDENGKPIVYETSF